MRIIKVIFLSMLGIIAVGYVVPFFFSFVAFIVKDNPVLSNIANIVSLLTFFAACVWVVYVILRKEQASSVQVQPPPTPNERAIRYAKQVRSQKRIRFALMILTFGLFAFAMILRGAHRACVQQNRYY